MKAIIPLAGMGSRLKPHTRTQPKSMIPLAGKPILGHIMDRLIGAGVTEFVFVIGYLGDRIEQYITENYGKYTSTYVIQILGLGIGHAIWLAKDEFKGGQNMLVVLGDTIFETDFTHVFSNRENVLGVKKVEDPRLFGVAELNEDGIITKLVEKPSIPKSNLALVGLYYIQQTTELFECLDYNIKNDIRTQNEYHLTDALQRMIDQGVVFKSFPVDVWFDCGKKDIILQTNKNLLKRVDQELFRQFEKGNIIVSPVYIAPSAKIENSIIGPDVSIGEDAIIKRSVLKNSIIGQNAEINNVILEDSLVGGDARLLGSVHSLNIGDNAEINLRSS
ncbi:MAG: nucleotidyl transferase [Flavobacteriales bacterium]|nr:nucleotidyl transferase [Flavobacteriaceae bacterium]PHX91625.1 MAG: nucleotidyl transferase [Flavobacteriales bacterium]